MLYIIKGPFPDKDGREFVIVRDGKKRRKINYAKYVLLKEGVKFAPYEQVHHKDGDKNNNSPENLEKMSEHKHKKVHRHK